MRRAGGVGGTSVFSVASPTELFEENRPTKLGSASWDHRNVPVLGMEELVSIVMLDITAIVGSTVEVWHPRLISKAFKPRIQYVVGCRDV